MGKKSLFFITTVNNLVGDTIIFYYADGDKNVKKSNCKLRMCNNQVAAVNRKKNSIAG